MLNMIPSRQKQYDWSYMNNIFITKILTQILISCQK